MKHPGPDNAFWIDGEWLDWDSIVDEEERTFSRLAELEREAELHVRSPHADIGLVPYFRDLLKLAEACFEDTGRHLNVYGDIGELFGAIMYGIRLHANYAQGSDGRLGNDFVEIKTIAPSNTRQRVSIRMDRHFSKLLVVRIDRDFEVSGRMIARSSLPKGPGSRRTMIWGALPEAG